MIMYYADMIDVDVRKNRKLRFRIPRPLAEYGNDYDFRNRDHFVEIEFSSMYDGEKVSSQILPRIWDATNDNII